MGNRFQFEVDSKARDSFLFIIPARGGSKGVPRKNLKELNGKKLIDYSLDSLKEAGINSENIIVSSEDEEIIGYICARDKELTIIPRSKFLAEDDILTDPVMMWSLSVYSEICDRFELQGIEYICLIQCTNIWLKPRDIINCMSLMKNLEFNGIYDSLITVVEDHSAVWEVNNSDDERWVAPEIDPRVRSRRQEMSKRFVENGALYMCKKKVFINRMCRTGTSPYMYVMPRHSIFDIDSMEDFDICRRLKESGL